MPTAVVLRRPTSKGTGPGEQAVGAPLAVEEGITSSSHTPGGLCRKPAGMLIGDSVVHWQVPCSSCWNSCLSSPCPPWRLLPGLSERWPAGVPADSFCASPRAKVVMQLWCPNPSFSCPTGRDMPSSLWAASYVGPGSWSTQNGLQATSAAPGQGRAPHPSARFVLQTVGL